VEYIQFKEAYQQKTHQFSIDLYDPKLTQDFCFFCETAGVTAG